MGNYGDLSDWLTIMTADLAGNYYTATMRLAGNYCMIVLGWLADNYDDAMINWEL